MARLTKQGQIIGRVGDLSFYKMKGVEEVIVRSPGGPSKSRIKKSPAFKLVRQHNREFGARAHVAGRIMSVFEELKQLADHNVAGPIHSLVKLIQHLDDKSEVGQRNIELSRKPDLLKGFSLNRRHIFDSIVRSLVSCEISPKNGTALIHFPDLVPGINFLNPFYNPYFQFQASLGVVGDLLFANNDYDRSTEDLCRNRQRAFSDWFIASKGCEPQTLSIKLPGPVPENHFILVLTIGIAYGNVDATGKVVQAPHIGSAKILEAI